MRSGINLKHLKESVRPQDDLYRHVNGGWIDSAQIPADCSSDGAFYELYQNAENQVREIIEELGASGGKAGSVAQKIGDLYGSFMDKAKADELGISPIELDLQRALAIVDVQDFHKVLGDFEGRGLGSIFYQYITTDNMDSNTNIAYIGQSGLSLPDEAYYREDEFAQIRSDFVEHVAKMFALARVENPESKARKIL